MTKLVPYLISGLLLVGWNLAVLNGPYAPGFGSNNPNLVTLYRK